MRWVAVANLDLSVSLVVKANHDLATRQGDLSVSWVVKANHDLATRQAAAEGRD